MTFTKIAEMAPIGPEDLKKVERLIEAIRPMFAGQRPEVVTSVLADLMATALASYRGDNIDIFRDFLIEQWLRAMRALIPINEKIIDERYAKIAAALARGKKGIQ